MSPDQSTRRAQPARPTSSEPPASPEPPRLDPSLLARLAEDLAAAEWTVDRMDDLLSARARDALMRDQRVPALVELRADGVVDDPGAILTRLFVLGSTEEEDAVDRALTLLGAAGLSDLGLVSLEDGLVTACFDLRPHAARLPGVSREWWIASDLGEATTGRPLAPDHVLGIGGATLSLLRQTMRDHIGSALDIGTGCGIQALYLAEHADHVVATDLSARACAITRFNAALAGVALDVRQGSLFEPVSAASGPERFDLIVSNPPFVITPDSVRRAGGTDAAGESAGAGTPGAGGVLEYRDGGLPRDSLIGRLLREAPDHLAPGGAVQMLANWEIPAGADPDAAWWRRVDHWLDGLPVDAWVVQRDVLDPPRYIEMWMRDSGGSLIARDQWERTYADWLDDFDRAGTGAIGLGFLAARRPGRPASGGERGDGLGDEGDPLLSDRTGAREYTEELDGHVPTGADVARALAALRLPERLDDVILSRVADVTEERHYTPGEADPRALILHQGGGLGRSVPVDPAVAAVVGASDGQLSVGQILTAVAALTDQDVDGLRNRADRPIRELVVAGMLEVVGTE